MSTAQISDNIHSGITDLAQLELHSQIGHGGSAVVFKGKLGTLDCATKVRSAAGKGFSE